MREPPRTPHPAPKQTTPSGLVQGGLGGPERELLEDGQEEVFSRSEIELGRPEHGVDAGSGEVSSDRPRR